MRILAAGLVGLLALGVAGADVAARSAGLLITDMSLTALGSTDHPAGPDDEPVVPDAVPEDADQPAEPAPEVTTVQNILLVGTDSREGLTRDQMAEMEAFDHHGALTDTILWVQYLPDTSTVRMLAFTRDIAVETADHGLQKINALHPLEGANALIEQVEAMVGDDLDHYVEVDLAGLVTLTDAVGGVEICLDEPMIDPVVGTIPEGCNVLDGIDAGRFVRARQTSDEFGGGTPGRAARQQYFLRQAMREVLSAGTLSNPGRLRSLVQVASDSVVVDDGLSLRQMYDLANVFRTIEPAEIETAIVPVVAFSQDGLYYERLADDADEVFEAIRNGTPFPEDVRTGRDSDGEDIEGDIDGFGGIPAPPSPSGSPPSSISPSGPAAPDASTPPSPSDDVVTEP